MADDGTPSVGSPSGADDVDAALASVFPHGLPVAPRPGHGNASTIVRTFPLEASHLQALADHVQSGEPLGVEADYRIASIKRRHHRLAMLLAAGTPVRQAAVACGLHPTTVTILQRDPMFAELLALYVEGVEAEFRDTIVEMAELADDVIAELRDRFENSPQQFSPKELRELLTTLTDRSGNGPTSTKNVNARVAVVDGVALERLKARLSTQAGDGDERQDARVTAEGLRAIEGVYRTVNTTVAESADADDGCAAPGPSVRAEDPAPAVNDLFGPDA